MKSDKMSKNKTLSAANPAVSSGVNLLLRRSLPVWDHAETIKKTVALCKKNGFDEIAWFVNQLSNRGFFYTPEAVKKMLPILNEAREACHRAGIRYSFNLGFTLGHGEYGDEATINKFIPPSDMMVGINGEQAKECACPLSAAWKKYIAQIYQAIAATRPFNFWIDDDFRMTNHGPAQFTCYCEQHIRVFAKKINEPGLTREKLVAAILQPGAPHPWRAPWLDFLSQTLFDAVQFLRDAVHAVSPQTHVALMTTTPWAHELEGRNYPQVLQAAAGPKHPPTVRLCTSGYQEKDLRELFIVDEALKRTFPFLPPRTMAYTEIESMPFFLYSKSKAWIEAQAVWATILNVPNHTFNMFDHLGTPLDVQPDYCGHLRRLRPQLEAITSVFSKGSRIRGARLLSHLDSARHTHALKEQSLWGLEAKDSGWANAVRAFGLPITFQGDENVSAVTGQALRSYEDKIRDIFSKGVLLDLSGLETLQEMGYGKLAGVKIAGKFHSRKVPVSYESFTDPEFGGGKDVYVYGETNLSHRIGILEPEAGARAVSCFLNDNGQPLYPGVVLFENELGGRVAVYPQEFILPEEPDLYRKGTGQYFYTLRRKRQLLSVLNWLSGDKLPLVVEAEGWILPHRIDGKEFSGLAAMNLNLDLWQGVTIRCAVDRRVKMVKILDKTNKWKSLPGKLWSEQKGIVTLTIKEEIPPLKAICAVLYY